MTVGELRLMLLNYPDDISVEAKVGPLYGKYVVPAAEYDNVSGWVDSVKLNYYPAIYGEGTIQVVTLEAREVLIA